MIFGRDADEGNSGGACGSRIVDRVADVNQFATRMFFLNRVKSVGRRLPANNVIGADDRIEANRATESAQRNVGFIAEPAGEDGETAAIAEPFEQSGPWEPALARDQAVAVFAEEELIEARDDVLVGEIESEIGGDLL